MLLSRCHIRNRRGSAPPTTPNADPSQPLLVRGRGFSLPSPWGAPRPPPLRPGATCVERKKVLTSAGHFCSAQVSSGSGRGLPRDQHPSPHHANIISKSRRSGGCPGGGLRASSRAPTPPPPRPYTRGEGGHPQPFASKPRGMGALSRGVGGCTLPARGFSCPPRPHPTTGN